MNKIQLLGRIGQDVTLDTTPNGNMVAKFSIATTKRWKDKQGEKQEKTTWFRCVAWQKTGEIIAQYFNKGDMILVEGEVDNGSYEKDGVKFYTSDVIIQNFHFCGGAKKDTQAAATNGAAQSAQSAQTDGANFTADDIPF